MLNIHAASQSVTPPTTPPREPRPLVCPGAPRPHTRSASRFQPQIPSSARQLFLDATESRTSRQVRQAVALADRARVLQLLSEPNRPRRREAQGQEDVQGQDFLSKRRGTQSTTQTQQPSATTTVDPLPADPAVKVVVLPNERDIPLEQRLSVRTVRVAASEIEAMPGVTTGTLLHNRAPHAPYRVKDVRMAPLDNRDAEHGKVTWAASTSDHAWQRLHWLTQEADGAANAARDPRNG